MPGQNALVRYGFNAAEHVPGSSWWYPGWATEDFKMDRPGEPDPNIDASGNETESENLVATGTWSLSAAPNSESFLPMRAHQHGFYEQLAAPAVGVEKYELRDFDEINDDPVDHYIDSLMFGIWRDTRLTPAEYMALECRVSEFTLTAAANKYVMFDHSGLYLRDTYQRHPFEQAVNAAWTGDINVRGHRPRGDEDGDYIKFKVPVGGGGALGVATFVWGKGAAAYGATPYVTADVMQIMNADDTIYGTRREPAEILITAPGGAIFTEGDEWRIYPSAEKPVAVLSARGKLNATELELQFTMNGGASFRKTIQSFSFKMGTPREAKEGVGSKYHQRIGVPDNSKKWWEITLDKELEDLDFERARVSGARVTAYAKFYGTEIGATGLEDFAEFTFDALKVINAGGTVQSPGEIPEQVVLRAFPASAGASLCVERYQNTLTSIAP